MDNIIERKKGWTKKWRVFGLNFYVSNVRLKKRPLRGTMDVHHERYNMNKRKLYERQCGLCPHCGKPFNYEELEFHHILPVSRFPEYALSIRNGIMLCHACHKEVHINPFLNAKMITDKANSLGIDLKEHYDL